MVLGRSAGISDEQMAHVLDDPLPVSAIARDMGITRQAVQRTADVLVERGLADYRDNPAHRRAKLVALTAAGRERSDRLGRKMQDQAHHFLEPLTAEEKQTLYALLKKLTTRGAEKDDTAKN